MLKSIFLALVMFLLIISPIYCANLPVNSYGAYSYTDKTLSVFQKNTTSSVYDSWKLELLEMNPPTAVCGASTIKTTKATTNVSKTTFNLTFTNVNTGYFKVNIYGMQGATQVLFLTHEFYIAAVSENYTISWCNMPSTETLVGTTVYTTLVPSFTFGSDEAVSNYTQKSLTRNGTYFETKYMIFTNEFRNAQNVLLKSPASAQVVTFTVIPSNPTWDGISAN